MVSSGRPSSASHGQRKSAPANSRLLRSSRRRGSVFVGKVRCRCSYRSGGQVEVQHLQVRV